MTTSLLWCSQAVFIFFLTIFLQTLPGVITIISLAQCSHKPKIEKQKDKDNAEKKEKAKSARVPPPTPEKEVKPKQGQSNCPKEKRKPSAEEHHSSAVEDAEKEKERLKEAEEKRIEEIKPKIMKRNAKEERIAKGKETRGKGDYPTMDDVLSDWDSEKNGKKKNEDDNQKSKVNTNLEDADDTKKTGEIRTAEIEEKKGNDEDVGKNVSKDSNKQLSDGIRKLDKTASSQEK